MAAVHMMAGAAAMAARRLAGAGASPELLTSYVSASFERDSEAAFVDSRGGAWTFDGGTPWPAVDVQRIFGDGAILIERSRTNLIVQSEAIGGAPWAGAGSVTTDAGTAPDGGADAEDIEQITNTSPSNGRRFDNSGALTTALATMASAFVQQGTGSAASIRAGSSGTFTDIVPTATWQRIQRSTSAPGGSALVLFQNAGADGGTAVVGHKHRWWGAQWETGAFGSSPIRSAGSATTRAAEFCPIATPPAGMLSGHYGVAVHPHYSTAQAGATHYVYYLDASNYLALISGTTVRLRAGGVNYDVTGLSWAAHEELGIEIDHGSALTITGGGGGTVALSNDWSGTAADLVIGSNVDGTADHFDGVIELPVAA